METGNRVIKEILDDVSIVQKKKIKARMRIAAKIDEALKRKNWSQKQLANKIEKNPSQISKWLSGTHNFTADTLVELSIVLGINLLDLNIEHEIITKEIQITLNSAYMHPPDYLTKPFIDGNTTDQWYKITANC